MCCTIVQGLLRLLADSQRANYIARNSNHLKIQAPRMIGMNAIINTTNKVRQK